MIVNGIDKDVTEMTEETQNEHIEYIGESAGEPVAKARPKQTSTPTTSSSTVTLPYNQRDWSDVETGPFDRSCFDVPKKVIRLLRHDSSVPREEDGAVEFRILAQMFRSEFTSSSYWSIRAWLNYLQRGGGPKKRFQYCVDPSHANTIPYIRAIQGHSGGRHINPTLEDNVLLPDNFAEHIHHTGSSQDTHLIIQSGLIPGGKDVKIGRHVVFFTGVNPMFMGWLAELLGPSTESSFSNMCLAS